MCGRFEILTIDELGEVIREVEHKAEIRHPDWPAAPQGHARPGSQVAVIVPNASASSLGYQSMTWGFDIGGKLVFNTRIEKASGGEPGMWEGPLAHGRCLVAARAFFEPHGTETAISAKTGRAVKAQYRFCSESDYLLMAAVCQGGRFSIVTTAPNRWVCPIHDRMPMVLNCTEATRWLDGDIAGLEDRSAIRLEAELEDSGSIAQMSLF